MADRGGPQEHVGADRADFRRHVVDHDHTAAVPNRVSDLSLLVLTRTTGDGALHGLILLCVGVGHFGGIGSYTVMSTSSGCTVVQTTCSGLCDQV